MYTLINVRKTRINTIILNRTWKLVSRVVFMIVFQCWSCYCNLKVGEGISERYIRLSSLCTLKYAVTRINFAQNFSYSVTWVYSIELFTKASTFNSSHAIEHLIQLMCIFLLEDFSHRISYVIYQYVCEMKKRIISSCILLRKI